MLAACWHLSRISRMCCTCLCFQCAGVPVERQKLMAKGMWAGILRDDMNFSTMPLADGALVRHCARGRAAVAATQAAGSCARHCTTQITLIGTSAGVPRPPEKATVRSPQARPRLCSPARSCSAGQVFMEDMTTAEAAKTGKVLPAGLINLENTCYLNATVQVRVAATHAHDRTPTNRCRCWTPAVPARGA